MWLKVTDKKSSSIVATCNVQFYLGGEDFDEEPFWYDFAGLPTLERAAEMLQYFDDARSRHMTGPYIRKLAWQDDDSISPDFAVDLHDILLAEGYRHQAIIDAILKWTLLTADLLNLPVWVQVWNERNDRFYSSSDFYERESLLSEDGDILYRTFRRDPNILSVYFGHENVGYR